MAENRILDLLGDGKNGTAPALDKPISVLTPPGLVSIIVPCCGMLEYTKLCVPSVLKHSRAPFELIFLDIGSLDGTAEYLAGIKAALPIRVEIVRTQTDLGISDTCKEALAQARGEYLVLLNNDTVVTEAWLQKLIGLASMSPAIGLVGPMSNYAAVGQLIEETLPYRVGPRKKKPGVRHQESGGGWLVDVEAVNEFAKQYWDRHKGNWLEVERLGGFCLFMKREVLRRCATQLEKWTDLSLFDTDILSSKARQAGFTLAICRDLFIHHFGTRTFAHGAPSTTDKPKTPALQRR